MTFTGTPPRMDRRLVCVSDDPALAAAVSSLVGEQDEYVPVLIGPRMKRVDAPSEVIRRRNAAAKVRSGLMVLAGVDDQAEAAFRAAPDEHRIVAVHSVREVLSELSGLGRKGLEGELHCRTSELALGLLLAKRTGRLLICDGSAPSVDPQESAGDAKPHLVVLDDHDPMAQVIAANYAYSIGADLMMIPQREDALREGIYRQLDASKRYRGTTRADRALASLAHLRSELTADLDLRNRAFVTFVTRGIPYGYFYEHVPSTHLLSYPHLGEQIIAGIYWSAPQRYCLAAVVVDSGDFPASETEVVAESLARESVHTALLVGGDATVASTSLYIRAYPYDLLFICSHCGEVEGSHLTLRLPDGDGGEHIVEIHEAFGYGGRPSPYLPGRMVEVRHMIVPIAIDGTPWHEAPPELARHYEHILTYLHETDRADWDVITSDKVDHVAYTTAISLSDGQLILTGTQTVDVSVSPIVFNNSCVSYYDAAAELTFAGARAYVGTLAPVASTQAQELAQDIFRARVREESLPLALWLAQQRIFPDPDDRTYVHVGCHFNAIRGPRRDAGTALRKRISDAIARWQRPSPKSKHASKEAPEMIVRFLSDVLRGLR